MNLTTCPRGAAGRDRERRAPLSQRAPGRRGGARRALLWVVVTALAAGCTSVSTPKGFVRVGDEERDHRFVSARDARFWVRTFEPGVEEADLGFWYEALRHEFEDRRGYRLVGERSCDDRDGPARDLHYAAMAAGLSFDYVIHLRHEPGSRGGRLVICEYIAPSGEFPEHLAAVRDVSGRAQP